MRKIYALLFSCVALTCYSQKKTPSMPPCVTDQLMEKMIKDDPDFKERLRQIDDESNRFLSTRRSSTFPAMKIPVVVYVIHDNQPIGSGSNISYSQIHSQIDALNQYFEPLNIEFCLATRAGDNTTEIPVANTATDVQDPTEPGIIRVNRPDLIHNFYTSEASLGATANSLITKQRYLRIWIVKTIEGSDLQKGYAYFPGSSSAVEGVVIRSDVFGKAGSGCACNLDPHFVQGTILVHEIGHYLGLYHTFFEGCTELTTGTCSTRGDRVCDTPPVAAADYHCTVGADTCAGDSSPDANQNFMDYGIDCATEFSLGQMQKIFSTLSLSRHTLVTSQNIFYTGACNYGDMLYSNFTASNFSPCASSTTPVVFTAPTMSSVNYSWDFGDGSAVVNTPSPSVSHLFTTASGSPFTVKLTVSNTTETVSSSELVYVTACGSPASNAFTRWYVPHSGMLEFDSGVAKYNTSFPEIANTNGACAIQNDANGNLMFYTTKRFIYNSSNVITNPNNPLVPDFEEYNRNNSVVIVPKPGSATQYYVFTNTGLINGPSSESGFRYTIVNANGSLTGTIKQPVTTPVGYDVSPDGAVNGGNGIAVVKKCDGYWILTNIAKTAGTISHYLAVYSLTSAGLAYKSVIYMPNSNVTEDGGYVKASPNGDRIFTSPFYLGYIFDFNKVTGQLSNPIILGDYSSSNGGWGAAFSPDSKKLYLNQGFTIEQYDLDAVDVMATRKELPFSISGTQRAFGAIQAGPDKKLYISLADTYYTDFLENSREMAIIHKPNTLVTTDNPNACQFSLHGPNKTFGNRGLGWELPNMLDATAATAYDNTIYYYPAGCGKFRFFPNVCGVESFKWEFKNLSTNATVTIPPSANFPEYTFSPGDYSVKVMDSNNNVLATINRLTVKSMATPVILGNDQACAVTGGSTGNSVVLSEGQHANWSITSGAGQISGNGDQADVTIYWTQLPGTISVTVTNSEGCQRTATKTITSSCTNNGANDTVYTISRPEGASTTVFGGNFTAYDGVPINRIARIDNNLSLDTTFNVGSGANNTVYATAVQGNSKVLIGGIFTQFNGTPVNGITRLNADGSLDSTFTGTGVAPAPGGSTAIKAISAMGNTKIMIAGYFEYYNGTMIRNVARLFSTGALDTSFTSAFPVNSSITCMAVQPNDGKIILGGSFTLYGSTPVGNIVRLNIDGTIDSTFAANTGTGFSDEVSAIKIQADGKILVGGNYTTFNGVSRVRFARLLTTGALDTAFNPPTFPVTGNSPYGVLSIDTQPTDNKILVGGTFMSAGSYNRNGIVRLNYSTGSVDTSYNPGNGFTYPTEGRGNRLGLVYALSAQSDGRFIAGGSFTKYNDIGVNNITRINPAGNVVGRNAAEPGQTGSPVIYVYPNPFSDNITIVLEGGEIVDNAEVYNILGQRVKTVRLPKGADTIALSELPSGTYLLKLFKGKQLLKTEKIIKK